MKVLVFPRNPNPYQGELYGAMRSQRAIDIEYVDGPTPSQTLNVLLLPLVLASARLRGARILHIHWVYPFGLTWARSAASRRLVQWWYLVVLRAAVALDFKMVWTAHNIVPHEQVFHDELAARRALVERCDLVITHSDDVASVVRQWSDRRVTVVPPGISPSPTGHLGSRAGDDHHGVDRGATDRAHRVRFVYFGMIREYKGVDLLLDALATAGPDLEIDVVIIGECNDDALHLRLEELAASLPHPERLDMKLTFVPEVELTEQLMRADFAVFPFRSVTSSSSVNHALAAGLPVIIPALVTLDDVVENAAIRYVPAPDARTLVEALTEASMLDDAQRATMSAAASRAALGRPWSVAAAATWQLYDDLFAGEPLAAMPIETRRAAS